MKPKLFADLISLVYPNYCLGCETSLIKGEEYICTRCFISLPKTNFHLDDNNSVIHKLLGRIQFEYAFSYLKFVKSGSVQKLLYHLKYLNKPEIGEVIGKWYGYDLKKSGFDKSFDVIIPVPLHASKLKTRGYNQCDGFAKGLAEILELTWDNNSLKRLKKSETQTRKSRNQRWSNVEDIFDVVNDTNIQNQRILIVDDVITTGATIESCAQCLLSKGKVKSVSACAIASAE